MERKKLLEKAFQRGHLLSLKNRMYKDWIAKFILDETKGDIGQKGDITSDAVLANNPKTKAIVHANENGIVAGIEETLYLYRNYRIKIKQTMKDGAKIKKGDIILRLEGREKDLLKIERSALDLLQRMSGIATLTYNLIRKTKNKVAIAPTRKTHWRYMDKKAVFVGGGLTHRLALWESILVKDNHLAALKKEGIKDEVGEALKRAWKKKKKSIFIEIEATNMKDVVRAAEKFKELQSKANKIPCLIMLDNIKSKEMKKIINELKKKNLYNSILLEASGGINPNNIISYANSGVDVLSLGYLTHSVKALNIKQKIIK